MGENYELRELGRDDIERITDLTVLLNPDKPRELLESRQKEMFKLDAYKCFGFFDGEKLVGLSSLWTTVKLYSGKQLELDNVIIDSRLQSKGYGKIFFDLVETWAKDNDYETIELNTYVQNHRSHKFYFNLGFSIKGYHFQKEIGDFKTKTTKTSC